MARFIIGTSGYDYRHWGGGVFYPAGLARDERLPFYARTFSSVEINNTFYRLPEKRVFEAWERSTPDGFQFAVKGSRLVSHFKRLKDSEDATARFFVNAAGLGSKLSAVLWQLPANVRADQARLARFCGVLTDAAPEVRQAFEFRHESWFTEETYAVLRDAGYALAVAHSPRWPRAEVVTAPYVYLRFHGGERLYSSDYSESELRSWAEKARAWHEDELDVYAYFNNDPEGFAVRNALRLSELLGA